MPRDRRRSRQGPAAELTEEQLAEQAEALEDRVLAALENAEAAEAFAKMDPKPGSAAIAMSARQSADALLALTGQRPPAARRPAAAPPSTSLARIENESRARAEASDRLAETNAQAEAESRLRADRAAERKEALADAREMAELEERALMAAKARLEVEAQSRAEAEARAKLEDKEGK